VKLEVYRPVAGSTFTDIAEDVHDLTPGLNVFPTNIPVRPGDTIGLTGVPTPANPLFGCGFGPNTETYYSGGPDQPIGSQVTFAGFPNGFRLNVSAVVEPTNTFSVGKAKRNRRTGTATLALDLPNPGDVAVSGNGVKAASARSAKSVSAGTVKLKIRAKGRKLGTLNRTGKVKLAPIITYTPTNGSPSTESTKVKLKKSA
jgi:hypothetical protein